MEAQMAWLITVGLTTLMVLTVVVMIFMRKGAKRILKTLLGFLIVLGLFVLYAYIACGPNAKDVEIITPQINTIAKHIVASGVPSSLAGINNLEHALKGCKRNKRYHNRHSEFVNSRAAAVYSSTEEECWFEAEGRRYEVQFDFVQYYRAVENTHGAIKIRNNVTHTGLLTSFDPHRGGDILFDHEKYPVVYSVKTTGICSTMRQ
jgi:hypothetical protein